jgi:uncharacterized lipoprotein YmbA
MRYFILIFALFFTACTTKQSSFILPTPNQISVASIKTQVGVKKIELPEYLDSDKILVKNGYKLESIEADFATDASNLFTQKAITAFKRALNDPNVFLYPWDVDKKRGYIVEIKIDDYLYNKGEGVVNLNGTYYIKDAKNRVIASKNFNYSKESSSDVNSIVMSLNELFDNLIIEISQKIAR